jgi:aminoglycoside phosphotransferase (APT) family kinase protein
VRDRPGGFSERELERALPFWPACGRAAGPDRVITHGEPHPGNLMVTDRGPVLIGWDTVGLARPERDLWWVLGDPRHFGEEARS